MKQNSRRADKRYPCKSPMTFLPFDNFGQPPGKNVVRSKIVDVSDSGMRIRLRGRTLEEGMVLLVNVPLSSEPVTVPSLAQVKWIRKEKRGTYEAGVKYVIR
jgi:hypothetical protein